MTNKLDPKTLAELEQAIERAPETPEARRKAHELGRKHLPALIRLAKAQLREQGSDIYETCSLCGARSSTEAPCIGCGAP